MPQGAGQEGLANADRTGKDDVLLPFDEMQSKQLIQSRLIKRDRGGPVEVLQRAFLLKPGLIQPGLDGNLLPSLGLIAEDELKEFGVVELLATSDGQTVWQCVQHRRQLQPFQCCFQFG